MQIRNSIHLIGRVGGTPDFVTTERGTDILRFRFATNEYYRNAEGERIERTDWHTVKVFGKRAAHLRDSLRKGTHLAINGALRYEEWMTNDGQKRQSAIIRLNDFSYLDAKPKNGESSPVKEKAKKSKVAA